MAAAEKITALALFSGGLDSMMACRVIAAQNIKVKAVKFVTPFFGYELLEEAESYTRKVKERYDIDLMLMDVSDRYLEMLKNPVYGYGKNFNPCVDCKILLLSEARKMMAEIGASFIVTGEVIGQRPMSQRRDTLRVIERDSGCDGILLRPLCARNLAPTLAEQKGLVDREALYDISGRGRQIQMRLADQFGITDYPNPAGGCTLTDVTLGSRVREYYEGSAEVNVADIRLLLTGRFFALPDGGMFTMGRKEAENRMVRHLLQEEDMLLKAVDRPGPTGLLRHGSDDDVRAAAGLVARYARKSRNLPEEVPVAVFHKGARTILTVAPLKDALCRDWKK